MKQYLRSRVSKCSSYIEIYISVLILIGIILVSVSLIKDLVHFAKSIISGVPVSGYEEFLGFALQLIIGVEFVKMLSKHTPGSAIEVLLFAIARKLIVGHSSTMLDLLIGIIAIAILFAIKKFLFSSSFTEEEGYVVSGATAVKQVNRIAGINIPEELGNTIGGVVANELRKRGKKISEGLFVTVGDIKLRIYNVRDGLIDKVEIITESDKGIFGKFK